MYRESLQNHRDQILLSKQLATIHTEVPIEWDLLSLRAQPPNNSVLKGLYKELEFFSLLKDLPPEDDSASRDYSTLTEPDAIAAWLEKRPPHASLAVAVDLTNGFGLFVSHRRRPGCSRRPS